MDLLKKDAQLPKWMEKLLMDKEQNINRERKHADSEGKKAEKHKEVAESQKKLALEQKNRDDQLSKELDSCRLMLKELQKELKEFIFQRTNADHARLRINEDITETYTDKLLKKRLGLEKMLAKHANETANVEALSNRMLHRELFQLKQECLFFQQRLDFLDKSFLHGLEGTHHLEKTGNLTLTRETLGSDGCQRPLVLGIDSGLDPQYRGSDQNLLQSCVINSNSAFFSDRTLVGSQDRHTSSVTASDKLGEDVSNLKPTVSRLADQRGMNYNEHVVAEADNNIRSSFKDDDYEMRVVYSGRRVVYSGRKRILDAMESIENSYSMEEKLHQRVLHKLSLLDGFLNGQEKEHEDILQENPSRKIVRPRKRRKTSQEGMKNIHHSENSEEPKGNVDLGVDQADAFVRASPPQVDVMRIGWHLNGGEDDKFGWRNQCLPQDFDDMAACDHMRLLDLDDADDESSYLRAISMPLSPLLPEVDIHGGKNLEVDNPEVLTYKGCPETSVNTKDNSSSISSFHNMDMEKNPTSLVSLKLQPRGDSVDFLKCKGAYLSSDTLLRQTLVTDGKSRLPNLCGSGNKEPSVEIRLVSPNDCLPSYFILPSYKKDSSSILRILQTMVSCIPRCSFYHSTEMFLRSIQHALSKAEDLSMKEKVCVFFSLLLHGISEVRVSRPPDFLDDKLLQSFDSGEMFVCGEVSGSPEATHRFKANLVLNGNAIIVFEVIASAQLLVAGASLLASLCFAVGYIGFVCEMSCNIITMNKFDHHMMLAVLHAFAHVCSSQYFALQQYSVAMTVVKSLVTFLEKRVMSDDSSSGPSMVENRSKFCVCRNNCPFSEGGLSLEDVASLLLEKRQKHGQYNCLPQGLLVPRVCSHDETTLKILDLREDVLSSLTSDENLCDFRDTLSLLEILASFISWDWTFDHIIVQLCEYLESHLTDTHLTEGFSAAILVLLGQLGRVGFGASVYEDAQVTKLRSRLSEFACETTFRKLNLPVQFAIVTSLFGLTRIKFDEVIEGKVEIAAAMCESIPASFVKDWFFRLSCEQQSAFRLHQAGNIQS
ncbi:maternal effect embryo arrest protein [Striga asiatica]|uniref:Maternal effect embryo arrest protein n=1 Tax=Striga asiatica TaxID=4170 RepID=A0A5A7NVH0_STRAF|nr:maternal effect embryo arrest protein [Striga asiatica]